MPIIREVLMFPAGMLFVVIMAVIPSGLVSQIIFQRHRERMAKMDKLPASNDLIEERLDRIEKAVDAMSIEMERVGEGQRFVTMLLAEQKGQLPALPSARPGKFDTPH